MSVIVRKARGRASGGGSYHDAIDYALREGKHADKEPPLDVFAVNLASLETSREEMTALAREGGARNDTVYHVIVSWEDGEHPTSQEAREAARIVAESLGMEQHQYVGSLQNDGKAGLYHLHIVFNRVDPALSQRKDGSLFHEVWSDYKDYPKLETAGRAIEQEQGWRAATYGQNKETAGLARGARDAQYYDVQRSFQTRVRDDVGPTVSEALATGVLTWGRLHAELRNHDMRYVVTPKGARVEGIRAGEYAGVKKFLGKSHEELVARLGEYVPDRAAGRTFEERANSAALEVRELYNNKLATWEDVHRAFDSRGLRYDRFGGGARIYDRESPAQMKASDADSKLRFGPMQERFGEYRSELTAEERVEQRRAVALAENLIVGERLIANPSPIIEAITNHDSTFTSSRLREEIRNRVHDEAQRTLIAEEIESEMIVLEDENGARRFTTQAILRDEQQLCSVTRALAAGEAAHGAPARAPSKTLDEQQTEAYARATSGRQLEMVTGTPGSGKTHLLDEVAKAWKKEGYRARAVSISNQAVRAINDETSLSARTAAKETWEWSQGRDRLTDRDVLIIDEVSMLDTKLGRQLLEEAHRAGAVVRAFGDDKQLQAVGRGDAMRVIRDEIERAGGSIYDMKETRRQNLDKTDANGRWMRQATRDLREGRIREGFEAYHSRGFVQAYDNREGAAQALVDRYYHARDDGKDVGLSAYRRDDVALLNALARNEMRRRGELAGADVTMKTAYGDREFAVGDSVVVRQTIFRDKKTSMEELRRDLERGGKTVYGVSRSNAGRADMEAAGIRARTVSSALRDRAWDRSDANELRQPMFENKAVFVIDNADRLDRDELKRLIAGARSRGAQVKLVVDEAHVSEARFNVRDFKLRTDEVAKHGDVVVSRKLTLDGGETIKVPRGVETIALNRRWTNGDTGRISAISGPTVTVVRNRDGARLEMNLESVNQFSGKHNNELDHAYASTVHREQGSTHDVHFRLVTRADDARSTVVAMTRHRQELHVAFAGNDFRHGFDDVIKLAERTRFKEMATDYTVVGHGREVRGSEIAAPTPQREPSLAREREMPALPARDSTPRPAAPTLPTPKPERTSEMATASYVPESLRAELERSGMTYEEYLNQQYARGSQGAQERTDMQVHDDTRSYHPVESNRDELANYATRWNRDQTVTYSRDGRDAFTDHGNRIAVHEPTKQNIDAAVQLAKEKYGDRPIQIHGSDEFKREVLESCVRQGVTVGNPELQKMQQELQQQYAREQGRGGVERVREPSHDDLVRHASLKDWEQFYGKGREGLAREAYEEARDDIAGRDVSYYQKIGYTRDQSEAHYHHARQSMDLPRDRQLERQDLAYHERGAVQTQEQTAKGPGRGHDAQNVDRTIEAYAKAQNRTVRDAGEQERVEGKIAMMKDRGDGHTTMLIDQRGHGKEYTRVDVPTQEAQQLRTGDQVQAQPQQQEQGHSVERQQEQQRELQREQQQERSK